MTSQVQSKTNGDKPAAVPYHYKMCGLDYVYLFDGVVRESTDYGDGVAIKNATDLHRHIGLHLVLCQNELNGAEVRFLRRGMDLTQEELAKEIGVTGQTVARYEKGETDIPGPVDRLLRALYVFKVWPQNERADLLERTLEAQQRLPTGSEASRQSVYFRWTDAGWSQAEAGQGKPKTVTLRIVSDKPADATHNVRTFPGGEPRTVPRPLPGYLAAGDKLKMAAKRASRPSRLGSLRLVDGGTLEITTDGVGVYAKFLRGGDAKMIQVGDEPYELSPSKRFFGFLEVKKLTLERARELIRMHQEAPERYPVRRR